MNNEFEQGIEYFLGNISGLSMGGQLSDLWINEIEDKIETLKKNIINEVKNKKTDSMQLQGNVAEVWHTDTFNLNAKIHDSSSKAQKLGLNTLASPDIKVGKKYFGSKYYKNAKDSLKAQSKTPFEEYMKLRSKAQKQGKIYSESDFLKEKQIQKKNMHKSMYLEQAKLIPTDQLLKARELVDKKIAKETALGNEEQVTKLKEIKATLTDIVKDKKGNESIPLTREQSQKLTESAKKGKLDDELLKECGIDVNKLVSRTDILKKSLKSGMSAAVLTAIISMGPTILNAIEMLISNGEIDKEAFKEKGLNTLSPTAKSFLSGSITAGLIAACKTGKLGQNLINANATIISTSVVLVLEILEKSIAFGNGRITKAQMADEIVQMFTITAFAMGTGAFTSMFLSFCPPLAALSYMLGSFLGSIIGSYAYNFGKNVFMSFCVDSEFTFFGIVDQNYELPIEIINEIGLDVFDYEKFNYNRFENDSFEVEQFNIEEFDYEKFGIKILKRGVLEIGKIGYI